MATLIPLTNSLELQWETDVQTFGLCTSIRRCTLNQSRLFAPGKQSRFFLFWIGMLPYLRKKQLRRLKSVNTSCAVQTAMTASVSDLRLKIQIKSKSNPFFHGFDLDFNFFCFNYDDLDFLRIWFDKNRKSSYKSFLLLLFKKELWKLSIDEYWHVYVVWYCNRGCNTIVPFLQSGNILCNYRNK